MDIYQLLPLLDGWERLVVRVSNEDVVDKKEIASVTISGWIVSGIINFTGDENTKLLVRYHDRTGRAMEFWASPKLLHDFGLIGVEELHGAVLCKADYDNDNYTILFSPSKPIPYFASKSYPLSLTVIGNCTINYFGCELILIVDREKFIESIRRILGWGVL